MGPTSQLLGSLSGSLEGSLITRFSTSILNVLVRANPVTLSRISPTLTNGMPRPPVKPCRRKHTRAHRERGELVHTLGRWVGSHPGRNSKQLGRAWLLTGMKSITNDSSSGFDPPSFRYPVIL